jgi:hypothetical protein
MKTIALTQGQIALVDDDDFERINAFKWCARWNSQTQSFYAVRYQRNGRSKTVIYMSRFILGTPKGKLCDHKNHNTLDNRKRNLRDCSRSQNQMNRGKTSYNTTGYKGVSKCGLKFRAVIGINNKTIHLGVFETPDQAWNAYKKAAKKYHGEFSKVH